MVATFEFHESNGAGETMGSVGNLNMGNTDAKELTPANNPITAGNNSYEKWVVGSWAGTFTQIDNVQFWMSAGSFGTGESIDWSGSETTYAQPVSTTSTVATTAIPTSDPGTANVTLGSSLAGTLSSEGRSDYIVLQYQTTASADPGPTNQKTFTIQWDEQ